MTSDRLTVLDGEGQHEYDEPAMEVARKALVAAADLENDELAEVLRRFARALPHR